MLQEPSCTQSELHSEDYNNFVTLVMAAEEELPEESPAPTRQASTESYSTNADPACKPSSGPVASHDPNELFLPSAASPIVPNGTHDTEKLAVPWTLSPESDVGQPRPETERQPSHNTLIRQISSMLGESPQTPAEVSAFGPPAIPNKSSQRLGSTAAGNGSCSPPQIRRKPLSRNSVSGDLHTLTKAISRGRSAQVIDSSSTSSPAGSPSSSMTEKLTPLTESLRSLSSSDYITVELDHPPVRPYADNPPAYAHTSSPVVSSSAAVPRARRRGTGGSSLTRSVGVSVVQFVRENNLEAITTSLKDGYNVNETETLSGVTPVMEAARYRRWEAARLLLKSGAKLHLKDVEGNSAMHYAAREGDTEMCQMLLDAGAHTADCNKNGLQPLELAVAGGHTETVLCLVNAIPFRKTNDDALVGAFLGAIKLGDTLTAQAVLAKGVKPRKLKEPWRMSGYAAQSGSLPMLDFVLNEGASLKARSPSGYSPLHLAALHGHQPMVERLLGLKVPCEHTKLAHCHDHQILLTFAARRYAGKAQTKKSDETALHVAAAAGHTSTALVLVAHKDANVTMQDADNQEPIHHAVRKGDIKLTAALLEHGATLKGANKYGWKAVSTTHLACVQC